MINAGKLLADLKRLRKVLDADLRTTHAAGAQRDAVQAEWREAFDLGRTRDTFEAFLDGVFDQAVVHWVLGCVFLRFLEDNLLVDRPFLSGPGERLELAKERQVAHFRALPHDSDTEYLLATFDEAARLPGMAGLFDPAHNPLFRLPLSGDGAMALIRFFREVVPETGDLAHDFTDPDWNTRFLGDLYQDLSDDARKRYALLQTPDFVEAWILDRTLEPAIREFGHERVTMIDPACGSGHFLLGGFERLLREWQRFAPGQPPAEQAQRALDAIAGVDLNPFAAEIARFRLLLAALRAAEVRRLASAPEFRVHLAAGDSLLHGRHFFRRELGGAEDGFRRVLRHHYNAEDTVQIDAILGRQYHVVVGNPPYIRGSDLAIRNAYREIYESCHMKYGLGVPFTERFFDLALSGEQDQSPGYVGLIVANGFMKQEFGSKLIEKVLVRLDITHVVDCSGAHIPNHGTPTVILFGRNRRPVDAVVRTVRTIKSEPSAPETPAEGKVWTAIVAQTDIEGSTSEFISAEDTPRSALATHPWNMGGGGAAGVQAAIEGQLPVLGTLASEIGITAVTGADAAFVFEQIKDAERLKLRNLKRLVIGKSVRDYAVNERNYTIWPHADDFTVKDLDDVPDLSKYLWPVRAAISYRRRFGTPMLDRGLSWYEFQELYTSKLLNQYTITFACVATHNHFVLERGNMLFNSKAPVIKLPITASEEAHLELVGLLNSSVACFWIKQVCHNKGSQGINEGAKAEAWERFIEANSTRIEQFPVAAGVPVALVREMTASARRLTSSLPDEVCAANIPSRHLLDLVRSEAEVIRGRMIALQEEIDWHCYRIYGLFDEAIKHPNPPELRLGERAFEIVMARQIESGDLESTWFARHGSTPVIDLPPHWSESYREVVEKRIATIEQNHTIGLIERPEYKRRWSMESWEDMEQKALRAWLLERMESATLWPTDDARLLSTNQLTDLLRRDADFLAVAALYAGRADVNLEALVVELVAKVSVPFLAVMRYGDTGMRKRVQWEETWERQRREDAIDADVATRRDEYRKREEDRVHEQWRATNLRRLGEAPEAYAIRMHNEAAEKVECEVDRLVAEAQRTLKRNEVGEVPAPPKFVPKDFLSPDFWRLRDELDLPRERFVSFPHCQRDADGSLVVTWAGYNHLKRALAIAAYYQERKDSDGWPAERLVPLLAGVIELVPWLLQWHNEYDPNLGARMGDYFVDFVQTEARALGLTEAAVAAWTPPATPRRGRTRRAA